MYELTTAIAAEIDKHRPSPPEAMSDDDLAGLFRSQPGYRKLPARTARKVRHGR